ncbi:rhomboid family intramembrane serine protease [Leucobacter sp. M11]|uniref:rhomboid family intramembrane serine protease n=1 Tax=Leucobacter sp. M11 TaxID=2993565 RepID=UPI002D7E7BA5|nr:rhomboid family intramembrane serine protease [Leucobacter sp. M11]MEB4614906.1 rhomboid family intramembrane serine protease [Leucobacter sp. M11]
MSQYGERVPVSAADACYRHPNRQSFILCQRCGRTICEECQTQSSVGVLCPECMREGSKRAQRPLSSRVRSGVASRVSSDTPVVTYTILILSGLVFAAQLIFSGVTQALWYAPVYSLPGNFEPWRMLTSVFTHSTGFLPHILFNMYALWAFGRQIELAFGRWRFLGLYLIAGFAGSVTVMLWGYTSPSSMVVAVVGASGAIFGIFGATFVVGRALGGNMTSLVVMLGINFAIGFMPGVSVSWQAHLGGLIAGALYAAIVMRNRGPRLRGAQLAGIALLAAALLALSAAFFLVLPALPLG